MIFCLSFWWIDAEKWPEMTENAEIGPENSDWTL